MEETNLDNVIFDIKTVVDKVQASTNVKFVLKNVQAPEYVATGNIKEDDLIALGFKYIGKSSYVVCPIYKYGSNIEAVFIGSLLHIYNLRG